MGMHKSSPRSDNSLDRLHDVSLSENIDLVSGVHMKPFTRRIKKKSTPESGLKKERFWRADSLVSCGWKADSHKKMRFQKYPDSSGRDRIFFSL